MIEKFKDKTPRPQRGKTAKDTRLVRFVDLNHTIEEINTEISTEVESLQTQIDNIPSGGSEYTETIVSISSAQILTMGTSPIELLPAPGANMYYDYKGYLEYIYNGVVYDLGTITFLKLIDGFNTYNFENPLDFTENVQIQFNSVGYVVGGGNIVNRTNGFNQTLALGTSDDSNPTLGDGTLRAIIKYKVNTFGA